MRAAFFLAGVEDVQRMTPPLRSRLPREAAERFCFNVS